MALPNRPTALPRSPGSERGVTLAGLFLWSCLAILCMVPGIQGLALASRVNHWVEVPCTVTKAALEVTPKSDGSVEGVPLIAYDFPWEGQTLTGREAHSFELAGHELRFLANRENELFDLRDQPARACVVNPADPRQTLLDPPVYLVPLGYLLPGTGLLAACTVGAWRTFRRKTPPPLLLRHLPALSGILLLMGCGALLSIGTIMHHSQKSRLRQVPCTIVATGEDQVLFRYEWNGHPMHAGRLDFKYFRKGIFAPEPAAPSLAGATSTCQVDPLRPGKAALEGTFDSPWWTGSLGVGLTILGIFTLLQLLKRMGTQKPPNSRTHSADT